MKKIFSHMVSAFLGALFVVIMLIGLDMLSTFFPIYIPNIFFKENINYYVNVESTVSKAIDDASKNVISVSNYQMGNIHSTGSGVIYKLTDNLAYIVTNNHVVANADKIEIETTKGYKVVGEVIGTDEITDLAVVTIPKGPIDYYLEFSDSNALKIGEYVVAIGNPLGLAGSATLGIISSINREIPVDINNDNNNDWYATVIQTDAAINPGNSGGALINLTGKLVGINSMKIASSDIEGIGFSIPSNLVMRVIADLESHGKVERPFLGIMYVNITNLSNIQKLYYGVSGIDYGLYIDDVIEYSSASKQGLKVGDVILEIEGQIIYSSLDFTHVLYKHEIGDVIKLKVKRNNQDIDLEITLESNIT